MADRVVVWKYEFEVIGYFELAIPIGARILETRRFYLLGTGHQIEDDGEPHLHYLGSFTLDNGVLVGHLFEIPPPSPAAVDRAAGATVGDTPAVKAGLSSDAHARRRQAQREPPAPTNQPSTEAGES